MPKKTVSSKVSIKTDEKLEEISDRKGISKSELLNRYIRQSIELEQGKRELVKVETDGGIEDSVNETEKKVSELRDTVEEQTKYDKLHTGLLIIGVLYLVSELAFNLPVLLTLSGIGIAFGLVFTLFKSAW
jgi:hypothetical protein